MIREIGFEFRDTLAPVGGRFLRNQFNVEERSLAGPVNVSGSGSSHNARRHVRDNVLIKPGEFPRQFSRLFTIKDNQVRKADLIQGERLGEGKAPSSLEASADHGGSSGGRGRSQSERIGELESTHFHADIDQVNRRVKLGQFRLG